MAVFKQVLRKDRLRQVPPQFSWIDHRLVRDRHISRCSADALALYLFLVTVADGQGLSYYADATICRLLPLRGQAPFGSEPQGRRQGRPLDAEALGRVRQELIGNQLIAWQRPLYQVLALGPPQPRAPSRPLPPRSPARPRTDAAPPDAPQLPASDAAQHIARILQRIREARS